MSWQKEKSHHFLSYREHAGGRVGTIAGGGGGEGGGGGGGVHV